VVGEKKLEGCRVVGERIVKVEDWQERKLVL